jgi:hypothetical protein
VLKINNPEKEVMLLSKSNNKPTMQIKKIIEISKRRKKK